VSEPARDLAIVPAVDDDVAVRADEAFFRTLAEMIPQMVWTKDAHGHNEYCTQKLLDCMNVSMHEFLHTPWETVHPDDAARGQSLWRTATERGVAYEVELRMRPKHSFAYRWFLVRAVPHRDGAGRVTKWFGTTTDIHAQKLYATRQETIATGLTEMIAPADLPVIPNLTLDGLYTPAEEDAKVGGDFYEASTLPDGRVLFAIGDVAGHGLLAALAMDRVRNAILGAALDALDPTHVLAKVNRLMVLQRQPMVTALVGFLDSESGCFCYASAGHPPPILAHNGGVTVYPYGGVPLGVTEAPHFKKIEGRLHPGSLLVLYTDGLIEFDRDLIHGEELLVAAIRDLGSRVVAQPARHIANTVLAGAIASDDIAVLTLRRPAHFA
jgi:PAS domain S-box-containing protein